MSSKDDSPKDSSDEPHYHGHRQRLRERFLTQGSEGLQDYELLELVLFRSVPRRDVKPIAKALMEKAGMKVDMQSMDWQTLVGRRAKKDALTVREHIDAAIKAAREGDAATMAEELYRASRAELEYGDDPSTRAARKALLGEGWIVDGGVLRYDPNTADLRRYEASAKET